MAIALGLLLLLGGLPFAAEARAPEFPDNRSASAAQSPSFERDILPIFAAHCWKCHGLEGRKAELDLRTVTLMLKGGQSGPAFVKGDADDSRLVQLVSNGKMPPEGEKKLSPAQLALLRDWVNAGAPSREPQASAATPDAVTDEDRQFWAFRKPALPEVPQVRDAHRVRTPIDAFVLAKLQGNGLTFAPDAAPITLIRRAYFDLIGLPPSPEEVDAFLTDTAPDAYDRLLDRLLASPHYGERWGRHWLDAAGYVDTIGLDNDAGIITPAEGKWRYRDYVVRSLNGDKPFDRFLLEQLAGDELVDWRSAENFTPEIQDLLVATGFLRTAADSTHAPELNRALERYDVVHNTIATVTSNLLGLTVACARCHSHKFDPIPQADYYRLMAVFTPALNPQSWLSPQERELPDVSAAEKAEIERHNTEIERQVKEIEQQLANLRRPCEERVLEAKLAAVPEAIRADTKTAVQTPADKRTEVQKYLVDKLGPLLKVTPEEVTAALSDEDKSKASGLQGKTTALNGQRRSYGKIQALYDVAPPLPTYLLWRGDHEKPGPEVQPGFLSVLCEADQVPDLSLPQPSGAESGGVAASDSNAKSSGRRLALARWLTRPDHPLTARVLANRVWQQYFGRGLVATPDNFGRSGARPTHPELLDWLAIHFAQNGWRLKALQKLIMTSTVYRQSSYLPDPPEGSAEPPRRSLSTQHSALSTSTGTQDSALSTHADPDNLLLWHMPLRRLESEIIRDTVLATSGKLDRTLGGPPIPIESRPDGMVVIKPQGLPSPTRPFRRSLYVLARRNYHLTELAVFDQPILNTNCTRRNQSAVSLQSLTMLNSAFILEQAEHFAARVAAAVPLPVADVAQDPAAAAAKKKRIDLAFRLALARPPDDEELAAGLALLNRQAERYAKADPAIRPDQAAQKALANLCQMLLNTNEFLYVE